MSASEKPSATSPRARVAVAAAAQRDPHRVGVLFDQPGVDQGPGRIGEVHRDRGAPHLGFGRAVQAHHRRAVAVAELASAVSSQPARHITLVWMVSMPIAVMCRRPISIAGMPR